MTELGHAGELIEYRRGADASVRWEPTSLGLVVSAVKGQRLYTDNKWPNPVVLKLENVGYMGDAPEEEDRSTIDGAE